MEALLDVPGVIAWFVQHGVSPFSCSGAFPGTLERLLEAKGVGDIDAFIRELDEAFAEIAPSSRSPEAEPPGTATGL